MGTEHDSVVGLRHELSRFRCQSTNTFFALARSRNRASHA